MQRCPHVVPRAAIACAVALFLCLLATGASAQEPGPSAPSPDASRPPAQPETPSIIPHSLEGRADCLGCHGPAGRHPYPQDHKGRSVVTCLACHVSAVSPRAAKTGEAVIPPVTNNYCLSCHSNPALSMTFPDGQSLSLFVDQAAYARSTHGSRGMPCSACHPQNQRYPHPHSLAQNPRELSRGIVQHTCFNCHAKIYAEFKESVHGKALVEEGNLDVPGCPDCHGVHNIRDPHSTFFRMESPDTCSKCHADPALAAKYGMSPDVTKTYLSDFHGASIRLTRDKGRDIASYKPVCYDCHGIHDIKRVDDPTSRVVKDNLVQTCRRCHPGADANFPAAWMSHYEPNRHRWPLVYWINTAYKILIPSIIGPMVLYILLDLFRSLVNRIKGVKHG